MIIERLIAYVLVASLRRYVAEQPLFLSEAFGDGVYETMATLTTIATDDPDADRRYWNNWNSIYDDGEEMYVQ